MGWRLEGECSHGMGTYLPEAGFVPLPFSFCVSIFSTLFFDLLKIISSKFVLKIIFIFLE